MNYLEIALEALVKGSVYSVLLIASVFAIKFIWDWNQQRLEDKFYEEQEQNDNMYEAKELIPDFEKLRKEYDDIEDFEESSIVSKILESLSKGEVSEVLTDNYSINPVRSMAIQIKEGLPVMTEQKKFVINRIKK
jgi:hypothetical protein